MLFLYISFYFLVVLINFSLVYNKTMTNLVFLVLTIFCSGFFFWMSLGIEFLVFAYFIVYVGAIMVMFLFVVMVIDVNSENSRGRFYDDFFINLLFNTTLSSIFYFMLQSSFNFNRKIDKINFELALAQSSNKYEFFYVGNYVELTSADIKSYFFLEDISIFGEYLFLNYYFILIMSALMLLIAMVVSILICQSFSDQKCEIK